MVRISYLTLAIGTLALGACGQQSSTTTVTTNNATGEVTTTTTGNAPTAASIGLQPGKWESKIEVREMTVGGKAMPKPAAQTVTSCLTPEQASKGPAEMLKQSGADCTFTSSNFAGGKIDTAMTCKMGPTTVTGKSSGTYTSTSMITDGESTTSGPVASTTKVHSEMKRIGDCS